LLLHNIYYIFLINIIFINYGVMSRFSVLNTRGINASRGDWTLPVWPLCW